MPADLIDSEVDICNLALSFLGQGKGIASLDEQSPAARLCSKWYTTVRDSLLRKFKWPFAQRIRSLTLVEEDPNDEWLYAYQYPVDCLDFGRILSGKLIEDESSRVPFIVGRHDDQDVIFTGMAEADGEYTERVTDVSRFKPDFVQAFALRLAGVIAPQLAGGDPFKRGEIALGLWRYADAEAAANAANEEHRGEPPTSYFERMR